MNARRTVLVTVLAVLVALLYLLQQVDDSAITKAEVDNRLPRYTLHQAVLTRYDAQGQPSLRATADQLEYFDDESAVGRNMVVDVLSGTRTPWHATAPVGHLPAHEHAFVLDDDVVADGNWPDNDEPLNVRTTQLWVDPDTHELHTDQKVVFTSATREGTAIGLRSNWKLQDLHLLKDVNMRYDFKR